LHQKKNNLDVDHEIAENLILKLKNMILE